MRTRKINRKEKHQITISNTKFHFTLSKDNPNIKVQAKI